ncbi:MAG: DNA translocase FtsK 4TM domain-containing protein [Eubacteriales bacterium]|nr:DNA translocase FtsK 4TM domain-containing protein [Eubacteriales bacterium]
MASSKGKNASTKRTAGSGRKAANSKKSNKTNRPSSAAKRKAQSRRESRIGQEELRAMEIRRDIRLLILLGAMVFVMVSELGYGGVVGRYISGFMFGVFGLTAYAVPAFVLLLVIFVISNLGRRTLPARVFAMVILLITAGAGIELFTGEAAAAKEYSAAGIYLRCSAGKGGGGLLGGSMAYGMYHLLRTAGSVLLLLLIAIICILVLTQKSPVSSVRRARENRIRRGEPSLMEKRRERAARRREEARERREYAREELLRQQEEREQLLEKEKEDRRIRRERAEAALSDPGNLDLNKVKPAAESEEEEDFGLDEGSTLFRRKEGGRTRLRPAGTGALPGAAQDGSVLTKGTSSSSAAGIAAAASKAAAGGYAGAAAGSAAAAGMEIAGGTIGIGAAKAAAGASEMTVSGERGTAPRGRRNSSVDFDLFSDTQEEGGDVRRSGQEREQKPSFFENVRISIAPVRRGEEPQEEQEEEERILRPDANTVRVESPGLITGGGLFENDLTGGNATMKVFASSDGEAEDIRPQFPFREDESEFDVKRVYDEGSRQETGAAPVSYDDAPAYDIADAGGMSTFRAQEIRRGKPAAADSEAQFRAEPAESAGAEESTGKRSSLTQEAKSPAVGTVPAAEDVPIDEEALSGIEVHRDRGGEGRAHAAATAVSGRGGKAMNREYVYPHYGLMLKGNKEDSEETDRELKETAYRLQDTLRTFGVNVTITDISKGPSVTRYELLPEQGVKVSKIVSLADDIKLSLAAMDIRIEAPIPGKRAIGIEVPNKHPSVVALRDILESREFRNAKSKLAFAVGKDLSGKTIVTDIARMPHMLIAGATGSGKSVCINTIIMSLLFKASPAEVQLIMVDPKVVELSVYNGIPHLMIPVVTDAKKASAALGWATAEMDRRYKLFAAAGVRDLNGYNEMVRRKGDMADEDEKILSRIVVIVDELADLMMVAKNDVEASICRLAQLARAAGIHLIIATQRPSVDVITGLIKANMPSRLAFAVASQVDSRTILDMAGAEKLIGKGDMLFYPQSYPKPARLQGAFVSDEEVQNVVDFIRSNNAMDGSRIKDLDSVIDTMASAETVAGEVQSDTGYDEHFVEAGRFIIDKNKASIGMLQRVFKIGFNRAARIMDQLAEAGVVSEENGTRARQVLMSMPQFEEYIQGLQ